MPSYQKVLVETYLPVGEASRSAIRVRPMIGQPFPQTMRVECSKPMRTAYPVGTCFEITAALKQKAGGDLFLYSPHSWPFRVLSSAEAGTYVQSRSPNKATTPARTSPKTKSPASYLEKLPYLRAWLVAVAQAKETVTYGDVMAVFDIDRFSLRHALGRLGKEARQRDEPIISALVVNAKSRRCSSGLRTEFGVTDDRRERKSLYDYWEKHEADAQPADESKCINMRALRFAVAAARPEQAQFRRLVFVACNGKCIVTECAIPEALDAAHKRGRNWRKGHNSADDGWLLRKDLHALYDAHLIDVDNDGNVIAQPLVKRHYPDL